jgi:polyisoprenoid-binding protein YceI
MKRTFIASVIAFLSIAGVFAQTKEWKLDRAHSAITFTVKHMVISEVTGRFDDFTLTLSSSKEDFTDATLEGTIWVDSIDTGNSFRDRHLKTDDFFNAQKYPDIKFKSTSVTKVGDNNYKINGALTIRDVTKNVTWDAVLNGTLKTSRGTRVAWKVTLAINRFDYGLKWDKVTEAGGLVAGDIVTITILGEFVNATGT